LKMEWKKNGKRLRGKRREGGKTYLRKIIGRRVQEEKGKKKKNKKPMCMGPYGGEKKNYFGGGMTVIGILDRSP